VSGPSPSLRSGLRLMRGGVTLLARGPGCHSERSEESPGRAYNQVWQKHWSVEHCSLV